VPGHLYLGDEPVEGTLLDLHGSEHSPVRYVLVIEPGPGEQLTLDLPLSHPLEVCRHRV
jgi:hypothetical protein